MLEFFEKNSCLVCHLCTLYNAQRFVIYHKVRDIAVVQRSHKHFMGMPGEKFGGKPGFEAVMRRGKFTKGYSIRPFALLG